MNQVLPFIKWIYSGIESLITGVVLGLVLSAVWLSAIPLLIVGGLALAALSYPLLQAIERVKAVRRGALLAALGAVGEPEAHQLAHEPTAHQAATRRPLTMAEKRAKYGRLGLRERDRPAPEPTPQEAPLPPAANVPEVEPEAPAELAEISESDDK
jgi:hypothetical protein